MKSPALNIIKAQAFSDKAKGYNNLLTKTFCYDGLFSRDYYMMKDIFIKKAIREIQKKNNPDNISFYVTRDMSIDSYLVYFNFKIGNERYQISFHSFNMKLATLLKGKQPCKTKWDKNSSRDAAIVLGYYKNIF